MIMHVYIPSVWNFLNSTISSNPTCQTFLFPFMVKIQTPQKKTELPATNVNLAPHEFNAPAHKSRCEFIAQHRPLSLEVHEGSSMKEGSLILFFFFLETKKFTIWHHLAIWRLNSSLIFQVPVFPLNHDGGRVCSRNLTASLPVKNDGKGRRSCPFFKWYIFRGYVGVISTNRYMRKSTP